MHFPEHRVQVRTDALIPIIQLSYNKTCRAIIYLLFIMLYTYTAIDLCCQFPWHIVSTLVINKIFINYYYLLLFYHEACDVLL